MDGSAEAGPPFGSSPKRRKKNQNTRMKATTEMKAARRMLVALHRSLIDSVYGQSEAA
jgi:hypothetical protein